MNPAVFELFPERKRKRNGQGQCGIEEWRNREIRK